MMWSPTFCERVLRLSDFLRFQCSVKPREGELAIIATAARRIVRTSGRRMWCWRARPGRAKRRSPRCVIGRRGRSRADERAIIAYVRQLLRANRVDQTVFDALKERYGVPWVVELTGLIGHYGK